MIDCNHLIHPFQHDPGVSQRQRLMDELLSGSADIDGRSMADLLDYFMQLSRHINFYETDLSVSDWQPFFKKSLPFTVAAITKFEGDSVNEKLAFYNHLFKKQPSPSGLQLLVHYIYHRLINPLNSWQLQLKGSELPVAFALEKLNKDKLQLPVKEFIKYANAAVQWYCIKPVDWQRLHQNEVWDLYTSDLYESDESFKDKGTTRRERTTALYDAIRDLAPVFLDVMRLVADAAALSMDQSLIPLKDELREKHQPHLTLLFAFLKLFRHLQDDLNSFTKKHLDFFYKQVLQLKPREATPDKAHIVFEIQNQLDSYLLKEGLHVKDGKDNNKAEVFFELDDEIVVNKTQVTDKRTLFLNNKTIDKKTYVEGVYMAPDAGKADGIDKDFKENGLNSFATLGAKNSKYTDPEHGFVKLHPNARLGFILASPVLLLNEGERTVEITLACELKDICNDIKISAGASSSCCEDNGEEESETFIEYPSFVPSDEYYDQVKILLNQTYYYINRDLMVEAVKQGVSKEILDKLNGRLIKNPDEDEEEKTLCYCPVEERLYETMVTKDKFKSLFNATERTILKDIFPPRKALNLLFSGEKKWIKASAPVDIELVPDSLPGSREFALTITATLEADKPAITFYDKEQLKEDFNITLPLVKIELDDKIKIEPDPDDGKAEEEDDDSDTKKCCLKKNPPGNGPVVSLYHFFRNIVVIDKVEVEDDDEETTVYETGIAVRVCGLKNFIVQNDESVQDVNVPIYPFGTRPKVGASFYIGSKELFSKDWQEVYVNAEWKDKPEDFKVHYEHYSYKNTTFEDGSKEIKNDSFLTTAAVLDKGQWKTDEQQRLFTDESEKAEKLAVFCNHGPLPLPHNKDVYDYIEGDFAGLSDYERRQDLLSSLEPYNVASQYGFLRFTLEGVSFQHDIFPFVLTRQMMAYAGLLSLDIIQEMVKQANDAKKIIEAMITDINHVNLHIDDIDNYIGNITDDINNITTQLGFLNGDLSSALADLPGNIGDAVNEINHALGHLANITSALTNLSDERDDIQVEINFIFQHLTNNPAGSFDPDNAGAYGLIPLATELETIIEFFVGNLQVDPELKDGLPSEPYTPIIKNISLDYSATAEINDIDLIHLYPYEGTYKPEELESEPTLLPTFCDEGTLFLGLKDLVPGGNVNILFQLAEATADSESEREELHWFYLDNNQWKLLREGFEVLDDATDGLTASGIIKFALPANMTGNNTILPTGLHWIKAAIPQNSRSVSETIGIHTQAVQVTFTNEEANDKMRLADALPVGSIAKLKEADASVKKVSQLYDGFGGRLPEAAGHFYVKASELLRHKGRSVQKFDYERLALEAFPQLFKVKCINHSFGLNAHEYFNDFPVAPGYVLLAVIPDLNQLKAAASFEPRAPVSVLEQVKGYLGQRTSPFVRLKIMNPRYEKVHFCLKVKLYLGKDENFYKAKLIQELREFLAPWVVGQYEKLTFGQCIYKSDIVRFLESRDYLDYIIELKVWHEKFEKCIEKDEPEENGMDENDTSTICKDKVCPDTPRSILIAGDIDVCIQQQDCETWQKCKEDNGQEINCCDQKAKELIDYCEELENN